MRWRVEEVKQSSLRVAGQEEGEGRGETIPVNESRPRRMLLISPRYGTIKRTNTPSENIVAKPYPDCRKRNEGTGGEKELYARSKT